MDLSVSGRKTYAACARLSRAGCAAGDQAAYGVMASPGWRRPVDPRIGKLVARALVIPHRAADPPAGAVPVQLQVVDAAAEQRSAGRAARLIDAAHLGHIAE